jgi:predicted nucleic acid-binding protein
MGLRPYYLGDTSAVARLAKPTISVRLAPLIEAGLVARCTPTDLEAGFSARSPQDYLEIKSWRASWPAVPIDQPVLDRAYEVQGTLATTSRHRGAALADLIVAAAAERAELVVLHYDADFDLIAEVTGQPVEWIVPSGTAD